MFVERGETEAEEKDAEEKRTSQLYSLLGCSDDDESDSTHRGRKKRDRGKDGTRRRTNSQSQERAERMSGSRERKDRSRERGKDNGRKDRRDSGSRRSSLGEDRKRKVSCSSAESEYSRKSGVKSEHFGSSASKQVESGMRRDTSRRMSFDDGRYENMRGHEEIQQVETARGEKGGRKGRVQEEGSRSETADGVGSLKHSGLTSAPGGGPKRELPSNLMDIFNQIAQFEKEKGVRPK